jgi:hypothetical protein
VNLKFDAPKTQVMGVIINGVLGRELNWGLVIMGAMIAVALELCGVSSLTFAVGVYIPLIYSLPIFIGGVVRWLVDTLLSGGPAEENEASAIAAAETSPGVLMASGYIAGGSLAGVAVAFLEFDVLEKVKTAVNFGPALEGSFWDSDVPAVIAFGVLTVLLALAGKMFGAGAGAASPPSEPAYPAKSHRPG